jgi:hypothetical protein
MYYFHFQISDAFIKATIFKELLAQPRYRFEDMVSTCPKFEFTTINNKPEVIYFDDRIVISTVDEKVIKFLQLMKILLTKGTCDMYKNKRNVYSTRLKINMKHTETKFPDFALHTVLIIKSCVTLVIQLYLVLSLQFPVDILAVINYYHEYKKISPFDACARRRGSLPIAETPSNFEMIYKLLNGK